MQYYPKHFLFLLFVLPLSFLVACASTPPEPFEVTRVVTQELVVTVERPVEVEVTREVVVEATVEVPVEVEVEVTRVVEVMVTPTAVDEPESEPETETETETTEAETAPSNSSNSYTVQPNDNLSLIASRTATPIEDIRTANNLVPGSILQVGQELTIPGWDGQLRTVNVAPPAPTAEPSSASNTPEATAVAVTAGVNLFPNPSFEEDWYFHIYNELQIPNGWQFAMDEGPNTLDPGSGGVFNRPEVRVVPSTDLPPAEHSKFIFDGQKTIKAFKGGAPTSFSIFTDIALPAGTYQYRSQFFPDTVLTYEGGSTFSTDPLAAEARIIFNNGGTDWQSVTSGQRNVLTYEFTLNSPQTVRIGTSFRNRFIMANNGWFIDDWSLYAVP